MITVSQKKNLILMKKHLINNVQESGRICFFYNFVKLHQEVPQRVLFNFDPKLRETFFLRAVLKETNQRKTKLVDFEDTKGNNFSAASTDQYLTEKQLKEDCSLKVANLLSFTNFVQNIINFLTPHSVIFFSNLRN